MLTHEKSPERTVPGPEGWERGADGRWHARGCCLWPNQIYDLFMPAMVSSLYDLTIYVWPFYGHLYWDNKKRTRKQWKILSLCFYYVTRLFLTLSDRQSPEVWGPVNSTRILGSLCASFRIDKDVLYTARALTKARPKELHDWRSWENRDPVFAVMRGR